ncbi:MAG TPA: Holliday junction branch migration protein RuvA [Beutenbergiaceae bacterium]|nr:Holliday junction branch migration protein RuvA [Beutenbergiaceae bacterium]
MIASVRGQVVQVSLDCCVVESGGLGYRVHATPGTLAGLRTGSEAILATSLVVREDSMTLFGFADWQERDIFEMVQTVSGVGPRLALAMLAVHSPDGLRTAVATEDVKALTLVPGIGQKGARRIILDLGDRLGPPTTAAASAAGPPDQTASSRAEVVAALTGLGWPVKAAEDATAEVLGDEPALDTAGALRAALQRLGRSKHG